VVSRFVQATTDLLQLVAVERAKRLALRSTGAFSDAGQ